MPSRCGERAADYRGPIAARSFIPSKTAPASGKTLDPVAAQMRDQILADLLAPESFVSRHLEPKRRKTFRDNYTKRVAGGESRHAAMMSVLGWAAREVAPGLVSADVFNDLHADWNASFRGTDRAPQRGEFAGMLRTSIGKVATADDDPAMMADLLNRARRDFGTDHRDDKRDAGSLVGWFDRLQIGTATHDQSDEAPTTGQTVDRRNAPPLDLRRLRTQPRKPVSWLLPDVLACDSYVSLSAAPGTGKSVIARVCRSTRLSGEPTPITPRRSTRRG